MEVTTINLERLTTTLDILNTNLFPLVLTFYKRCVHMTSLISQLHAPPLLSYIILLKSNIKFLEGKNSL